jgi:hypothetical protein
LAVLKLLRFIIVVCALAILQLEAVPYGLIALCIAEFASLFHAEARKWAIGSLVMQLLSLPFPPLIVLSTSCDYFMFACWLRG